MNAAPADTKVPNGTENAHPAALGTHFRKPKANHLHKLLPLTLHGKYAISPTAFWNLKI